VTATATEHAQPENIHLHEAEGFDVLVCTENLNPHVMVMKSAEDRV
jgi:hypothetical protein